MRERSHPDPFEDYVYELRVDHAAYSLLMHKNGTPDLVSHTFEVGEEVFVKLSRDKNTGRAVVLAPVINDPDHKYFGRVLVRFNVYCLAPCNWIWPKPAAPQLSWSILALVTAG